MDRLEIIASGACHQESQPTQSLYEKRIQERLRKAVKMLNEYGFSMTEACKEAKFSKNTVKKWQKKLQEKQEAARFKLPKQEMRPQKKARLHYVKSFIDANGGNVFIRDI